MPLLLVGECFTLLKGSQHGVAAQLEMQPPPNLASFSQDGSGAISSGFSHINFLLISSLAARDAEEGTLAVGARGSLGLRGDSRAGG